MATLHTPNWQLSVEVEQIEITSNAPRTDPAWKHVDKQGHVHAYGEHGSLPTLTWVVDYEGGVYCDEDGYPEEYPDKGHWECVQCGEHIEPGMRGPSLFREYMPGRVNATLHTDGADYWVTGDQVEGLQNRMRLTRDRSIWDRIVQQFVEAHPDQRIGGRANA